ncbi:MAG: hypothetical protein JO307_17435 [Bryobacterales bacterium]|nr:hypothetical protein [Bryobacterales bacterium]MBV9397508.1 hypothetical protein [Bryobacterales bacterium]
MTTPHDPYWDELGIAWSAIETDTRVLIPKLQARLRSQSLMINALVGIGLPVTIAGFVIGAFTVCRGFETGAWNFVTRGSAIVIASAMALKGLALLLNVRTAGHAESLSEMLVIAVARSERTVSVIHLCLGACGIALVLGVAGAVIRARLSSPPLLSPVIDTAILLIVAVALLVYLRQARITLAKFRYLKDTLAPDAPSAGDRR